MLHRLEDVFCTLFSPASFRTGRSFVLRYVISCQDLGYVLRLAFCVAVGAPFRYILHTPPGSFLAVASLGVGGDFFVSTWNHSNQERCIYGEIFL